MTDKFYTPKEVAEILRVKRNTVIKLILNRKLSATIVGKQYRVSAEQLAEFYKTNTIQQES
jgi:putative molybdopterin biosynthesis protein